MNPFISLDHKCQIIQFTFPLMCEKSPLRKFPWGAAVESVATVQGVQSLARNVYMPQA